MTTLLRMVVRKGSVLKHLPALATLDTLIPKDTKISARKKKREREVELEVIAPLLPPQIG